MTDSDIRTRIEKFFPNAKVEVLDLTGTRDHYEVRMINSEFKGMSRIKQHRAVMGIFDVELKSGEIHAFVLKTETGLSD